MYVSEITRFLNELKAERPRILEQQREGRAIWWDKSLDLEAQERFKASRVPQAPYVYKTKS
ncbi:MAG: DUF3460 family protein [Burkholderiaceae bacterium]